MNFFHFFPLAFSSRLGLGLGLGIGLGFGFGLGFRLGFLFGLDQFPEYLHEVNSILAADHIAGTDKERLCVSKILLSVQEVTGSIPVQAQVI